MKKLEKVLENWPSMVVRDADLKFLLRGSDDARYSTVKRALKSRELVRLRRGLYLISSKTKQMLPDEFELALFLYGPSMVSFESALSYHNVIPEAVYVTTCATPKRAREFETPIGTFSYDHVPPLHFYLGVRRVETASGSFFIAEAWRALADLMYTRHKTWTSFGALDGDLRADVEVLCKNKKLLSVLSVQYPSARVRKALKSLLVEASDKPGVCYEYKNY